MYLFNHIPKCGGLSYRALLEDLFGKDRVTHISINREEEYNPNPADYLKYPVLMGHFGVRWNDIIGPGRQWMTVLREPVDRVASTYYFWRHNAPLSPESPWLYLAQTKSLNDYVRSGHYAVRKGIQNFQTRQLADEVRWRYRRFSDRDALEVAKENLGRFGFIGFYEEFGPSVERMCKFLGTASPSAIPHVNPTSKRLSVDEIPKSTIDAIMELNRSDLELYAYARSLSLPILDRPIPILDRPIPSRDRKGAVPPHSSQPPALAMHPINFEAAKSLRLRTINVGKRCACRDVIEAIVEVSNDGPHVWSSGPPNPLVISYHWFDHKGETVVFDGWRSEIQPVLQPFSTGQFRAHVVAPTTPGTYTLRITLVQEFVRWFDNPPLLCFEDVSILVENIPIENAVFSPEQFAVRL